jgi:hypothetical protein
MCGSGSAGILALSGAAFAEQGQSGTPQEARAMLDKAVAAVNLTFLGPGDREISNATNRSVSCSARPLKKI